MTMTRLAGLTALLLVVTTTVANAQSPLSLSSSSQETALIPNLTPFQLVNLAYEGGLQAQGIPSYMQLESAYKQNRLNASTLIAAAIEARYVPASALNDSHYVNAVWLQLRSIGSNNSDYRWP